MHLLQKKSDIGFIVGVVGIFAATLLLQAQVLFLNHDNAWLIVAAQKWLAGEGLYSRIIETNPPLAIWWSGLYVILSDSTGMSLSMAQAMIVMGLGSVSLLLCWRQCPAVTHPYRKTYFLGIILILILLPGIVFGQREYLQLSLMLPYIFWYAGQQGSHAPVNSTHQAERILLGFLAGVGLCFKPHALLVPVLLELHRWYIDRKITFPDVAGLTLALTCLVYVNSVFAVYPDYMHTIIPLVTDVYGVFQDNAATRIQNLQIMSLPLLICMVLYGVYRKPYAFKGINTILLVAALGFMGSVLLQGKMWLYHFIPVLSLSLIFLHGLTLQASIVPRVAFYCAVIMVALRLLISPGLYLLKPDNIYRQAVADLNHLTPKPRNVYFFSTGLLMTANVSLAADLQWVSRFSSLFYLPALYGEYPAGLLPHRRQEIEQFFVQGVIEDFQKNPPDVVLVDTSKNIEFMGNADFSFLKHYLQYPAFAQIWQQYTYVRNIENFSVYQRRLSNDH